MIRTLPIALAAALAVVPLAASAQVTAGTELNGTIDQSLDSKNAVVGQRFTMSNVHSQDNNVTGAVIYGHVCDVQSSSQGRNARISLCTDKLRTRSGNSYVLDGRITNAQVSTKTNASSSSRKRCQASCSSTFIRRSIALC